ncbi:hypothetical protein TRFO_01624 [Tritrichomonas foetus]|uniref:Uncharacterized protein n=1 Tax=Tritrichomonas foetus TaxID=1144522 RepID=A0A1J4JPH5_9EUKA|nr:hypothetical protein TRFO_01624 [Tritrichomonas foetus]|eukprot:OHT01063.1 hypothetical protein TRFO_01624 [Tritrichomonas foetus]
MADLLAPTRFRITTTCAEVKEIADNLKKQQPTIRKINEKKLNEQILSIFDEANELLKTASTNVTVIPKQYEVPYPQIALFRSQIEKLNAELDRRTRMFDTTIEIARQAFSERLDKIHQEYKNRLFSLKNENMIQESELEQQLKDIQKSFESRLHDEISVHMKERNELQTKVVKLQSEYDLLYSNLSSSLSASQMRADMLEKQKEMLIETNENVTSTIHDKFQQQLEAMRSQCAIKITSLETENANLSEEIDSSKSLFDMEMERLVAQLQSIETSMESKLHSLISQQNFDFEKRKRKMETKHQRNVSSIRHKIETEEMATSNEAQLLRTQIEQRQKFLADADRRYEESVANIEKKTETLIAEKENEMKMMTKIHKKSLKQLEQKHVLQLEQATHDAAKQKRALELKLQQTKREGEITHKRLQQEINALTRAKIKFMEDIKRKEEEKKNGITSSRSNTSSKSSRNKAVILKCSLQKKVIADVAPCGFAVNPLIESEIHERLIKFNETGKKELASIAKGLDSIEQQFSAEQLRLKLKIDDVHRKREFLENEKKKLIERTKTAQAKLDELNERKIVWDEAIDQKQNEKIATLHSSIAQMKDEIAKIKEKGTKKVPIEELKAENQKEIDQLNTKLEKLKSEQEEKEKEIRSKYESIIEEESQAANKLVTELNQKYEETMNEIKVTKEDYRQEALNDHQKWMATRKEMADSNNRLMGVMQTMDKSRNDTPNRLRNVSNRAAPLPILRK